MGRLFSFAHVQNKKEYGGNIRTCESEIVTEEIMLVSSIEIGENNGYLCRCPLF